MTIAEQKLIDALKAIIKEAGPAYATTDDEPTGTISTIVHIARAAIAKAEAVGG